MSGLVLLFCLLIGSISCVPTKKQLGVGNQDPAWPYWYGGGGGGSQGASDPGSSSSGSGVVGSGVGSGVYGGQGGASDAYGGDGAGHMGSQVQYPGTGGQQGVQQDVLVGHPDDSYFWTDVADLEPLYAFDSRSRYQRGRVVFAQTRYTPTEYGYPDVYPEGPGKGSQKS